MAHANITEKLKAIFLGIEDQRFEELADFEDTNSYAIIRAIRGAVNDEIDHLTKEHGIWDDVELDELDNVGAFWDELTDEALRIADEVTTEDSVPFEILSSNRIRIHEIHLSSFNHDVKATKTIEDVLAAFAHHIGHELAVCAVQALRTAVRNQG